MAEVTKVKTSNGTIYDLNDSDDYTKDEVDALLSGKADVGDSYTKAEEDALLDPLASKSYVDDGLLLKANVVDVYSKVETDNLLSGKADTGVSYTKAEADTLLAGKADVGDSYTKAEADTKFASKATFVQFQSDVNVEFQNRYTKSEDDALLANKADSSGVYTKAEVDALIGGIKMFPDLDWANPLYTFSNTNTEYTATQDCWMYGRAAGGSGVLKLIIDNTEVSFSTDGSGFIDSLDTGFVPIKAGTTVKIVASSGSLVNAHIFLHIYKEVSA